MAGKITSATGETFEFDVIVSEQYGPKNAVTDFPVEDGTNFSDHIQRQPLTFTVVAILSVNPFSELPVSSTRLMDAIEFLDRAGTALVSYESTRFGERTTLALEAWSYTNDVMERLEFTLGFKEVRIAQSEIVSIPRPAPPAGAPKRPCGPQPAKTEKDLTEPENKKVAETEKEKQGSWLFKALN